MARSCSAAHLQARGNKISNCFGVKGRLMADLSHAGLVTQDDPQTPGKNDPCRRVHRSHSAGSNPCSKIRFPTSAALKAYQAPVYRRSRAVGPSIYSSLPHRNSDPAGPALGQIRLPNPGITVMPNVVGIWQ